MFYNSVKNNSFFHNQRSNKREKNSAEYQHLFYLLCWFSVIQLMVIQGARFSALLQSSVCYSFSQ